jgi:hypothetical protein
MNSLLQLLGSIASLLSIPLAIYLFLRSREAQLRRVREDITRSLSYQIGEARPLSDFEIQSVIDSHARASKIKKDRILADEIVEDLVAETIRNPMIPSSRKQEVIDNLSKVHTRNLLIMHLVEQFKPASEKERVAMYSVSDRLDPFVTASSVFIVAFSGVNIIVVGIIYVFFNEFWTASDTWPITKQAVLWLVLGASTSIVAAIVSLAFKKIMQRSSRHPRSIGELHSAD